MSPQQRLATRADRTLIRRGTIHRRDIFVRDFLCVKGLVLYILYIIDGMHGVIRNTNPWHILRQSLDSRLPGNPCEETCHTKSKVLSLL